MSLDLWTAVDDYLTATFPPPDAFLEEALAASRAAGLPPINVSPQQGQLLCLLARLQGARNMLEIGTLGGYSTLWLAKALPQGGRLVTLELDQRHAQVAEKNFARAGLSHVITLRLGRGLDILPQLAAEDAGPFDLTFIDADKPNNPAYFRHALELSRPGSVIIVDNVIRRGKVVDGSTDDPDVDGVRRLFAQMSAEPRVTATAIQTVGSKGYDGFALALVSR